MPGLFYIRELPKAADPDDLHGCNSRRRGCYLLANGVSLLQTINMHRSLQTNSTYFGLAVVLQLFHTG